jgi:DNA adenine methylase
MYLDPPYPGNGVNYFHNMRDWDEHHALAERLSQAKCKWILSSYDTTEVHELFSNYPITRVESSSGMKTKKDSKERVINREVLVTNYEPRTYRPLKQRAKTTAAQQLPLLRERRGA